jgi:hypothetical protein
LANATGGHFGQHELGLGAFGNTMNTVTTLEVPRARAAVVSARSSDMSRYLSRHHLTCLFTSPEWIDVIARTYGIDVLASLVVNGSGNSAILFSLIRDVRGDRVVCLPFSDYCDPLVESAEAWTEAIKPLLDLGIPIRLRCLRNELPAGDSRFALRRTGKWHGIDLSRAKDQMWAELSASARQNIRHALKSGVVVREGTTLNDVRIFYRMHAHTRKNRHRLLAQPFSFFETLCSAFSVGNRLMVLIAEVEGSPVAGILLLQWKDILYYKFNASVDQRGRPNDLLLWHAMQFGYQRGLKMLDFGLSETVHEGLVRYKRKFATEERDIRFFEYLPHTYRDLRAEDAHKILGSVTELLTDPDVPDRITDAASQRFYHLFA